MADPKGFLKEGRKVADRRPVEERVDDWSAAVERFTQVMPTDFR